MVRPFAQCPGPLVPLRVIGADAWFERAGSDRFEIQEQTIRVGPEETLTLLVFCDAAMLEEQDYRGYRR